MLLASTLKIANFISPSRNRFILSSIKVEKVVKLPRIPINKKVLKLDPMVSDSNNPHNNPMMSEPSKLTASVP